MYICILLFGFIASIFIVNVAEKHFDKRDYERFKKLIDELKEQNNGQDR